MSRGIQRNSARAIAKRYNNKKIPYKVAFGFSYGIAGCGKAMEKLGKALSVGIKSVSNMLEVISKTQKLGK